MVAVQLEIGVLEQVQAQRWRRGARGRVLLSTALSGVKAEAHTHKRERERERENALATSWICSFPWRQRQDVLLLISQHRSGLVIGFQAQFLQSAPGSIPNCVPTGSAAVGRAWPRRVESTQGGRFGDAEPPSMPGDEWRRPESQCSVPTPSMNAILLVESQARTAARIVGA